LDKENYFILQQFQNVANAGFVYFATISKCSKCRVCGKSTINSQALQPLPLFKV